MFIVGMFAFARVFVLDLMPGNIHSSNRTHGHNEKEEHSRKMKLLYIQSEAMHHTGGGKQGSSVVLGILGFLTSAFTLRADPCLSRCGLTIVIASL